MQRQKKIKSTLVAGLVAVLAFSAGALAGRGSSRRALNLPGRGHELPFSDVVVVGDTIHVAGTLGLDAQTRRPPADPRAEARILLDLVKSKLELVGAGMDDLVSVQVFCSDLALYEDFNEVYRGYFSKQFPARAFIGSGPLLFGARFEINAVAVAR
jgi:enamine deaminase RidA (YjgF/YER057c/UK114 family)